MDEELIRIRPDVKVILSSGYTEDVVSKRFPCPKPAGFLNKPYKLEVLKAELERLLGDRGLRGAPLNLNRASFHPKRL